MNTTPYILSELKALSPSDSVAKAVEVFRNQPISHLPIIENNQLVGLISESDIHAIDTDTILKESAHLLDSFFADESTDVLELLKRFTVNESNILPVLNKEQQYIGYFELNDILELCYNTPFLSEQGLTLIIEKATRDFSFSEISQIVESNKAKLLGVFITENRNDIVQIGVKFYSEEINEVIQSFRRYDYKVITEHKDDYFLETLKERADYLRKYLSI
ncbi:MAG: acetoin utilization protein acuB [Flavobacteriaceae bacterium]|nr:MAG: acetoin utilization protein acuB [Flavobacteriaceae bacterium]